MEIIDKGFRKAPKNYVVQSLLAVVAVAIILYFVEVITHAAIVAALGASAFIVFATPHAKTAKPRKLIGGHTVGVVCGSIGYSVFLIDPLAKLAANWDFIFWFICALIVGLSIFVMAITNTEHPPAAGTALGLVAHEWSVQIVIFVLLCAISLAIIRRIFWRRLRDLV
jgi:CBS-domain-containing membrane protein